jgi:hypothetical protein
MTHDDETDDVAEEPTHIEPPSVIIDTVPPPPNGFRDELTVASETRTIRLEGPPAWHAIAEPDPPPRGIARDPLFWPVVVFVTILVAAIGIKLISDPKARAGSAHGSTFQ